MKVEVPRQPSLGKNVNPEDNASARPPFPPFAYSGPYTQHIHNKGEEILV